MIYALTLIISVLNTNACISLRFFVWYCCLEYLICTIWEKKVKNAVKYFINFSISILFIYVFFKNTTYSICIWILCSKNILDIFARRNLWWNSLLYPYCSKCLSSPFFLLLPLSLSPSLLHTQFESLTLFDHFSILYSLSNYLRIKYWLTKVDRNKYTWIFS